MSTVASTSARTVHDIAGNAPDSAKQVFLDPPQFYTKFGSPPKRPRPVRFAANVLSRLAVKEMSILSKTEEPLKEEARMVFELQVTEDMLNAGGNMHGGCSAFILDTCTVMTIALLPFVKEGIVPMKVSQTLNVVYHSPAMLGDTIRVVCSSMTIGARASSCRGEIWNATHHRLAVSGVHVVMPPGAKL